MNSSKDAIGVFKLGSTESTNMKAQYSGIGITEASGKYDNGVHTKNRGGHIVRAYVIPTNTITPRRTTIRAHMATLSQAWSSLPQSNRDEWNEAVLEFKKKGVIGIEYYSSGFNYFISQTFNILQAGGMSSGLPIKPIHTPYPYTLNVDILNPASMLMQVDFTDGTFNVPPNTGVLLSASIGVSQGINYKRSEIILIDGYTAGTDLSNKNILAAYTAVHGVPISGTKVFFTLQLKHAITGQASPILRFDQIVG